MVSTGHRPAAIDYSTLLQLGAQTISARPSTRLDFNCAAWRCRPQRKQERVWPVPVKGEPVTLAASRRPFSETLVEGVALLMALLSQSKLAR